MDSAGHNKKGTSSTPPKLIRHTRRQAAEAKRKAEEAAKRLKEEKRRKTMFTPRKHGRIGPYDLTVDRNLPKIYIGQEEPEDAKHLVKLERQEEEVDHADNMDAGFEVFQRYEEMEEDGVAVEFNLNVDKVLPLVLPMLKQKDVFRCRLVSKQWCGMVDDFIEELIVPQHYDDKAYLKKVKSSPGQLCPLPKFRIVQYAYKFKRERELEKFNETMKSHTDSLSGLSPFVGGATVTFKNLFVNLLSSYFLSPATKIFLENFGVHIRRLVIYQGGMDPDGVLDCVKKCLHYVPSLERLKIVSAVILDIDNAERLDQFYFARFNRAIISRNGRKWVYDKKEMADLQFELYRNEMLDRTPKLENLDTLELHYFSVGHYNYYWPYLEEIVGDIMIKPYYQTQLKTVQLDWANNLLNLKLSNAKELKLVNLQCKLKDLKFQNTVEKLTLLKPFSKVNFGEIFQKFPRLRYLTIDKCTLTGCLNGSNFPGNSVHTLEIMDLDNQDYIPYNLGFVLPKLRYLILRSYQKRCENFDMESSLDRKYDQSFENRRVKIAHLIFGGTSYDSNVWTTLAQLEVLTFQYQVHSCSPMSKNRRSRTEFYECKYFKGTKFECPFNNLVETRDGFQRYQERVSRLMEQCLSVESAKGANLEMSVPSQTTCSSKSQVFEKEENTRAILGTERDRIIKTYALPFILPFLDRKDIMKCRQVDKQWRGIVDDFIGNSIVPQYYDDKAYLEKMETSPYQSLPKFRTVELAYHFKSGRILEQFNEMMESHLGSGLTPFVGGATITLDNLFVNSPLLIPALKIFLEDFGVHILHLVIRQTREVDYGIDVVRFIEYVKLCLQHVPNLERLKVIAICPVELEQSEINRIKMNVYRNELLNRSPELSKLTSLQLDISYVPFQREKYIDEIFHDIMIKPFYESQLKHLQLFGFPSGNINLKMCNLKELTLNVLSMDLRKNLRGNWLEASVEKLNLIIDSTEVEFLKILKIFPSVGYLKLENSTLSISEEQCSEKGMLLSSNNIHTLELVRTYLSDDVFRGFPEVRFLFIDQLNYPVLKRLSGDSDIYYEDQDKMEQLERDLEKGEMDFLSFIPYLFDGEGGTTFDTNIWEILPKIEVIELQYQYHECAMFDFNERFECSYVKGTKVECPFRNFVETRDGYERYHERLSRLMKQLGKFSG